MRGAKRDGDARRRVRAARGVQKRVVQPAASRDRSAQRPELSSSSRVPVDVRPCVHMWVPTAHCPPDHIAERAVESMLPATTAVRTHTRSPPSPRRTHAHAQSHGGVLHSALVCE